MAARSPRYPYLNLEDAIERAERIRSADRQNAIPRDVAAKHMGYSGLSGASDKAIAALMHYDLLEKVGKGEVRITKLAVDILFPESEQSKRTSLMSAALAPRVFSDIHSRYPDGHVSEDSLRAFLVREGFLDSAVDQVVRFYDENRSYLKLNGADDFSGNTQEVEPESSQENKGHAYGGAALNDLVQWELNGVLQLERPLRVVGIHETGDWVFVEGSSTGIPMSQVIVTEQAGQHHQSAPVAPPTMAAPVMVGAADGHDEKEWVRTPLGKGASARILVTEDLSDAQIDKLTAILLAMKEG